MATYKRILLKLSGEALAGDTSNPLDPDTLDYVAEEIASVVAMGTKVALVVGAGNLFRGGDLTGEGSAIRQVTADQIGMIGTAINGLALRDVLERAGHSTRLFTPWRIGGLCEAFNHTTAKQALDTGAIVVCAGGTGNPLFTTDTAASLRAIELDVDIVVKATQVDGVYSADPLLDPSARRFDRLSFNQVIQRDIKVMDLAAFSMCRDHNMPIVVYQFAQAGALARIVGGSPEGTLVSATQ